MAVITEAIPQQGFDIVQNRIAEILVEEITNQIAVQELTDEVNVFVERIEPFDKSEDVVIMVYLKEGDYDGYTQRDTQGTNMYFIDVYAGGEASDAAPASISANRPPTAAPVTALTLSPSNLNMFTPPMVCPIFAIKFPCE